MSKRKLEIEDSYDGAKRQLDFSAMPVSNVLIGAQNYDADFDISLCRMFFVAVRDNIKTFACYFKELNKQTMILKMKNMLKNPSCTPKDIGHDLFLLAKYSDDNAAIKNVLGDIKDYKLKIKSLGVGIVLMVKLESDSSLINNVISAIEKREDKIGAIAASLYLLAKNNDALKGIEMLLNLVEDDNIVDSARAVSLHWLYQAFPDSVEKGVKEVESLKIDLDVIGNENYLADHS